MAGGLRLLAMMIALGLAALAVWAGDKDSTSVTSSIALPKVKKDDTVDTIYGHRIPDPYRWLEDANSPDTKQYVHDELAYTRSILDPLPGREQIGRRLRDLLSIGTIGTPQIGGTENWSTSTSWPLTARSLSTGDTRPTTASMLPMERLPAARR
jgi:hypothetical protein